MWELLACFHATLELSVPSGRWVASDVEVSDGARRFPPLEMTGCTADGMVLTIQPTYIGPDNVTLVPPVVATRIMDLLLHLCRKSKFMVFTMLRERRGDASGVATSGKFSLLRLLKLLGNHLFQSSRSHLSQLAQLLEVITAPLQKLRRVSKAAPSTAPDDGTSAEAGSASACRGRRGSSAERLQSARSLHGNPRD